MFPAALIFVALGLTPQLRPPTSATRLRRVSMVTQEARKIILDEEVDEAAMLAASTFPIKPDELINKAKELILANRNIQDGTFDESLLADDFRFCAPFVGGATPASPEDPMPGLTKAPYLAALRSFDLLKAFPDMNNNYHAFRVDPFEPNRVWFQTRVTATHTGELMGKPPTGKKLVLPPQAFSLTFNEAGQVTLFNVGYVIDRTVGNTGGLGGAFGFFWGTGNPLPFPECRPFRPSLQMRIINLLPKLLNLLPSKKK
jgi:predicted ester cyclase